MDINPIGNGNYYITIKSEEMHFSEVSQLVRNNLPVISRSAILETFSTTGETLIFVRINRGLPVVFTFLDFETVTTAASLCDSGDISFLAYKYAEYELIFYPPDEKTAPPALYEYCTAVRQINAEYQSFLEEQGRILLGPFALEQLKKLFT